MKVVTIPTTGANPIVVTINNTTFRYRAGETTLVPDDVAAVIENIKANMPKEAVEPGKPGQVLTKMEHGAAFADLPKELPPISKAGSEDGKVLQIFDGLCFWGTVPIASTDTYGGVKCGSAVADATDETDVVTQLNALIASLVAAGVISEYQTSSEVTTGGNEPQ